MIEIVQSKEGPPPPARGGKPRISKYAKITDHIKSTEPNPAGDWFVVEFDSPRGAYSCLASIRHWGRKNSVCIECVTRKRPDHRYEFWYRRTG